MGFWDEFQLKEYHEDTGAESDDLAAHIDKNRVKFGTAQTDYIGNSYRIVVLATLPNSQCFT